MSNVLHQQGLHFFRNCYFFGKKNLAWIRAVDTLRRQGEKRRTGAYKAPRRHLFSRRLFKRRTFDATCVKFWLENSPRSCCMHREKHFYFKMLITFEPNVAQRSVTSQNDHKSKACLPEASNTAFTMYSRLKRRLRRLYKAPQQL